MHRAPGNDVLIPIRKTKTPHMRESLSIVRGPCCQLVEFMNSIAKDIEGKMCTGSHSHSSLFFRQNRDSNETKNAQKAEVIDKRSSETRLDGLHAASTTLVLSRLNL